MGDGLVNPRLLTRYWDSRVVTGVRRSATLCFQQRVLGNSDSLNAYFRRNPWLRAVLTNGLQGLVEIPEQVLDVFESYREANHIRSHAGSLLLGGSELLVSS
jgi:hypothetical protein